MWRPDLKLHRPVFRSKSPSVPVTNCPASNCPPIHPLQALGLDVGCSPPPSWPHGDRTLSPPWSMQICLKEQLSDSGWVDVVSSSPGQVGRNYSLGASFDQNLWDTGLLGTTLQALGGTR